MGQFSLLAQRRFGFFYLTQLFGAFNDNVFKNALIIMITYQVASIADQVNFLVNLSAGLFILPFFLFSATAGQLADKYEKSSLIRKIQFVEILIMSAAAAGFYFQQVGLLIFLLFLMGAQSSLFGPVKYGILPQALSDEELVGGNALVQSGTFLAILFGVIAGGSLIAMGQGRNLVAIALVVVAVIGYLSSRGIPATPAVAPDLKINWNPFTETWRNFRSIRTNRSVFLSILGVSWFWFLGASYLTQLPNYTKLTLGGDETVVTLLLALFSIGIGIGSLLCEKLSGRHVEIGLVPLGALGLTVFGADLFWIENSNLSGTLTGLSLFLQQEVAWRVIIDFVMIGLAGGLYIVPLYSLVLQRCDEKRRSRTIAGNNILNALLMVLSAILAMLVLGAGYSIPQLFLVLAVLNFIVAVYIFMQVPEFVMRFLVWLLVHSIYRVRKINLQQVPDEGPAILVCNHVSFVDALIIAGCLKRPVRFVMHYKIFNLPLLRFIFKTARAIPVASATENADLLRQAYDEISAALKAGELVCVFPEGKLTSDGELSTFKPGVLKMLERDAVPVIPMALSGLWGSVFSRRDAALHKHHPRKFMSRIKLAAGIPVEANSVTMDALRNRVAQLRELP